MRLLTTLTTSAALLLFALGAQAVPTSADIVFIVDESGSMAGEQAFLTNQIEALDSGLASAGVSSRNYAVTGFGGDVSGNGPPRDAGGGMLNLSDAKTTLDGLTTDGGIEDGYTAIDFALSNYELTSEVANFILVTDEDRDVVEEPNTKSSITSALTNAGIPLNAILDADLEDGSGATALGVSSDGTAYLADGSGGFTTSSGGVCTGGDGSTCADYFDITADTGGASWDLNQLRAGGQLADSFTNAFLDIKVEEIVTTPPSDEPVDVPEPSGLALFGFGSMLLGLMRWRRR